MLNDIKRYCKERLKVVGDLDEKKKQGIKVKKVIKTCNINNDVICVIVDDGSEDNWILYYACSFHMCAKNKLFDKYRSCEASDVVMVNGSKNNVISMNIMKMKMFNRIFRTLDDIRYVPNSKKKLIFLCKLDIML